MPPPDSDKRRSGPVVKGQWFHIRDVRDAPPAWVSSLKVFFAGGFSGGVSKTCVAPLERTKVLVQIERVRGSQRPSTLIARDVWRREGITAFWKGNGVNVMRIVPNKGVVFMCNDVYLRWLTPTGVDQPNTVQRWMAGCLSGATVVTVTYPLDIAQTRITSGAPFTGIVDCWKQTLRDGGIRSIYKGYIPTVCGIAPYIGTQFVTYEKLRVALGKRRSSNQPTTVDKLIAGSVAGAVGQTISYPFDTIRRRLQVQGLPGFSAHAYNGMMHAFRTVVQQEGVPGLYRGMWLNVLRAAPSQGIQFAVYSTVKSALGV